MDPICRSSRHGAVVLWIVLSIAIACASLSVVGMLSPAISALASIPLLLVIGIGVSFPKSGVFARPVLAAQTGRSELALTFDDGPDPQWTPPLLELLALHNQKATFFVIGQRASEHPDLLRQIVAQGHELANHTWFHSYRTVFKAPRVLAHELERTNALIQAATGRAPRWFRTPVGLLSPRIPIATRLAGLELVSWTASARDGVPRTSVADAVRNVLQDVKPGAILVLHDARIDPSSAPIAIAIVKELLTHMDARGLRSVTLSSLCAS